MANISETVPDHPDFLPFYNKALPELPIHCDPVFWGENQFSNSEMGDMNVTSIDSAGNYDEPPKYTIDKYVDINLKKCRKEYEETTNQENEKENEGEKELIIVEEAEICDNRGAKDQPQSSELNSTQGQQASLERENELRRPFAHLSKPYQRPRSMFEKNKNPNMGQNLPQKLDWEKAYPMGDSKFVTVSQFRGRRSVHIRQFFTDMNNITRATKKGLVLTTHEWRNLTQIVEDVNKTLAL